MLQVPKFCVSSCQLNLMIDTEKNKRENKLYINNLKQFHVDFFQWPCFKGSTDYLKNHQNDNFPLTDSVKVLSHFHRKNSH